MSQRTSVLKLMNSGWRKLRDPLYRNALFLILTSAFGGLFGFTFWLIAARYYTPDSVGLSASILSLTGLLGSISSLGLGIGLIRFLPSSSEDKNQRINTSLTIAAVTALGIGLVFLVGLDLWSPAIALVRNSPAYSVMFLAFVIGFALTSLVDSSFLAARKASYVLHRSLLFNSLRLPILIIVVASFGALGIFFSFGVAMLGSLLVSLFLLMRRLYPGYLTVPSLRLAGIRDMVGYSMTNHIANLLYALPTGILPLLVLTELSVSSSAHFYVAWLLANLLFVVPISSAQSLFIEGSHPGAYLTGDAIRSLRFSTLLVLPGILFLFFAGPLLLALFGEEYSTAGTGLLRILALSAFFVTINSTYFSLLRVNKRMRELTVLSLIVGVGTVIGAYFTLAPLGLVGPGIAFLSIQASITGYVLLKNIGASKEVAKGVMRF